MTYHAMCARVMRGAACSPRERSARRAARDASTRLVLPFVLLQMVVSLVFPCGALALSPNDEGVLWGPTRVGIDTSGIVVCTTNKFDAALWAIGRWNTKIQLDNPKFAMLSNEGTGGHFYELASYFHSYAEVGTPNWPNAVAVEGYAISFGPDNVWLASVPSSLLSDAREDYNTVLYGGSLGGGSSGGAGLSGTAGLFIDNDIGRTGAYWTYDDNRYYLSHVLTDSQVRNGYEKIELLSYTLSMPSSGANASRIPDDLSGWNCSIFITNENHTIVNYRAVFYRRDLVTVHTVTDPYTGSLFPNTFTSEVGNAGSGKFTVAFYVAGTGTFNPAGVNFVSADVTGVGGVRPEASGGYTPPEGAGASFRTNIAGPPSVPPNNNWPDEDPTPTPDPPEVPGPTDDPTPQPDPPDLPDPREYPVSDPYIPDPDPPTNPVVTYDPNPTGEPTDYRPWLNAILVLLRKINTTLSDGFGDLRGWLTNHCDHIRVQIHSDSLDLGLHIQASIENGFVSFERWFQGTFSGYFIDELDYVIGQQFAELEDYLHSLFTWLASQFDFTFGGTNYDDSSVIYWLRRIYAQLLGGAPNPGDDGTVDEGFDWWAWLLGLITDALGGVVTDLVGDIGGFLSAIAQKFPFSIPADIALYLSLLDAPRETPVFTFVIPAIQGWWDSWEIEIDLSPYDDALAIVRSMVLIWWGFVLVLRTDWLGGVFDDGARMVTGFFDKLTGGVANA